MNTANVQTLEPQVPGRRNVKKSTPTHLIIVQPRNKEILFRTKKRKQCAILRTSKWKYCKHTDRRVYILKHGKKRMSFEILCPMKRFEKLSSNKCIFIHTTADHQRALRHKKGKRSHPNEKEAQQHRSVLSKEQHSIAMLSMWGNIYQIMFKSLDAQ